MSKKQAFPPVDGELHWKRMDFLRRLPLMADEAMRLGLHITGQAVHSAVRASGWEVTGDVGAAIKARDSRPQIGSQP